LDEAEYEKIVRQWSDMYLGEVLEFVKPKDVSNEEVFGDVYHSLIHSSISNTVSMIKDAKIVSLRLY
jgi:hypothetical protein